MHHTRRPGMARAIKTSSLFHLLNRIASLVLIGSGAYALYLYKGQEEIETTLWVLAISTGITILSWAGFLFWSNRCRCQLCMAPILSRNACNKHKNAKKLFGSYRTRLASSALFLNRFRCYFCGEVFSCNLPPEKTVVGPTKDHAVTTVRQGSGLPKKD